MDLISSTVTWRTVAITVFIVVVLFNVCGLTADALLTLYKFRTITSYVRDYWWMGVPIVALQVVGVASLAWHFWGPA